MSRRDWVVLGVSGATCSGKTTVASRACDLLPGAAILHQDDFFLDVSDGRHTKIPELNHINFELLSSVDIDGFLRKIQDVAKTDAAKAGAKEQLVRNLEAAGLDEELLEKARSLPALPRVLLVDGFLLFNDPAVGSECDVKVFFELDRETCWDRRKGRCYEPPDVPGYFDLYVWPYYLEHHQQVVSTVPGVTYLDGADTIASNLRRVLDILLTHLSALPSNS